MMQRSLAYEIGEMQHPLQFMIQRQSEIRLGIVPVDKFDHQLLLVEFKLRLQLFYLIAADEHCCFGFWSAVGMHSVSPYHYISLFPCPYDLRLLV